MRLTEAFRAHDIQILLSENRAEATRRNYRTAANSFVKGAGDVPVKNLGLDHVLQWKVQMREDGLQPRSINTNIQCLRVVLKFLEDNEFSVLDHRKIKPERIDTNRKISFLTPDEVTQLVEATTNLRDRAIIAAFFGTGCRLSELLNLDRGDFEEARKITSEGKIMYEVWVEGKKKKHRPVYYDETIKRVLDEYFETRTDRFKPAFISLQNRRIHVATVIGMVHKATRDAGLDKRVTPHVLRHSYVSDLGVKGAPIPAISKLVGHSKVSTTMDIYTHILDTQQQEVFGKYHTTLKI